VDDGRHRHWRLKAAASGTPCALVLDGLVCLPDVFAESVIQATPREPVRLDASLVETPRIGGDT
jgi:hypothetical protein